MDKRLEWDVFQKKVAEYTGLHPADIKAESSLYQDINLDSLGFFSLGMYLIKNFDIKIPLNAVASVETVGELWQLINGTAAVLE